MSRIVEINCTDEDIETADVHWYPPVDDPCDSVWVTQKEKNTDVTHTQMFNVAEATQLRDALNEFLEAARVGMAQ